MIKFFKVTKQFGEDRPALNNVSFEIEAGELVVITGPSGSGKTTLLKLLTREYLPTSGEIYFQDEHVNSLKDSGVANLRRKIGAVFQDYKLLPELNVWENLALTLSIVHQSDSEIAEKVTDLLKLVGLEDKAYLFPHQLSGGEAQRISIARALSTAPIVIFADEPTGNLDSATSLIIAKLLKKINQLGTTVLVTTHDPVVMKELLGGRQLNLEKGILTKDSKKDGVEVKKGSMETKKGGAEAKQAETEADIEAEVKIKKDEVKAKVEVEELDQKIEKSTEKVTKSVAKPELEKIAAPQPKKSFGFFGLFGKKKKKVIEPKTMVDQKNISDQKNKKIKITKKL